MGMHCMVNILQAKLPEGVVWPFLFRGKGVEMKRTLVVLFTVLLFSATGVYAELHDRGGGLIYDDVLDVTWLQDANYAYTSGYTSGLHDDDGEMTWYEAMEWAEQLEYGGFDDWRLPDGGDQMDGGEMGYMYNNYIGSGLIENLQPNYYWSKNTYIDPLYPEFAYLYHFGIGQGYIFSNKTSPAFAWAVRDGDVEPRVKYDLKGREYFPGILIGATTFGARFAGQLLNAEGEAIGNFDTVLNHQGGPIEQCGATNTIVYFKLKMKFFDGRRIVLVMPYGDTATADWDWDDAACPYGGRECDFYSVENRVLCGSDDNPEVSLVAEVSNIPLSKRRFVSRGFDEISGGIVYGWLIHTPPIFPAVIGTFVGN
jgi:hypothetical protein